MNASGDPRIKSVITCFPHMWCQNKQQALTQSKWDSETLQSFFYRLRHSEKEPLACLRVSSQKAKVPSSIKWTMVLPSLTSYELVCPKVESLTSNWIQLLFDKCFGFFSILFPSLVGAVGAIILESVIILQIRFELHEFGFVPFKPNWKFLNFNKPLGFLTNGFSLVQLKTGEKTPTKTPTNSYKLLQTL